MSKYDWEPTIILPSADKYNDFQSELDASLGFADLIQPWQPATGNAMLNLLPYLFTSLFSILRSRSDAVYMYKPTPINILGILPKFLSGTPVILDLDDLGSEVMKSQNQSKLQYKLVEYCERIATRYSSAIVVASTFLESTVKAKFPLKSVLVIPNGVEPSDYKKTRASNPRNAIYYFGAVNRLSLIDDFLKSLPDVIKSVPDTKITIVGGGSALDEAKQLVDRLNISSSVKFTGWVDMLDIEKYVKFADVAICYQPDTRTVRAASNMKVFQYMAMASVPVVSDVGDLSMYLKDGQLGAVVPPSDPQALSEVLTDLLLNREERREKALTARNTAIEEYSWETRSSKLANMINAFSKKKRGPLSEEPPSLRKVEDSELPFLSVVVCSYNGAKIIGRTIESIKSQNYPKNRFEIIVVDDGSTDNTSGVASSYDGVIVVKQSPNQGVSIGRNRGLAIAKGDIYVCSDDDCIYNNDWLRQIASGYTLENVVGVGGYLSEMEGLRGILNGYFSALGSGFPPIVNSIELKPGPVRRLRNYVLTCLHRLDDRQDDYVQVRELYGANSSFPIRVLKSVGGWDENMGHIEDRDVSQRILDRFPGKSFYAIRKAEVIHDPGIPLKKFLLRQYFRATDTYEFCRVNNIFPPIFPFPILMLIAVIFGLSLNPFSIPFIILLGPQILYFWWPYSILRRHKLIYLAFPYIQLAEEIMETAGIIRAYLIKRGDEDHAFN